jgi:hypothetical protein
VNGRFLVNPTIRWGSPEGLLRVGLSRTIIPPGTTGIGASSSLRLNPAKVSLVNPQPAFSFGGENRS